MKRIISFYRIHIRQKLFNQILVIYSIITVATLVTLSGLVYAYLVNTQVKKDLDAGHQALSAISSYLDVKHAASRQIFQQLYLDRSATLMEDVQSFLNNDFSGYLDERLSLYAVTGVRRNDIVSYLRLQLIQYPDIRAIALYSESKQFLFVIRRDSQQYIHVSGDLQTVLSRHLITDKSLVTVSNITSLTTTERAGNLIIDYDAEGIYKAYQNNADSLKGYVLVLKPDGEVIFDSSNRYYGRVYPYFSKLDQVSLTVPRELEEPSYVNMLSTNQFGYKVVGMIPKNEITANLQGLKHTLMLVTGFCITAAVTLTYCTILHFARRTRVIVHAIEKLKHGDLSVRIPLEKEDELYQIARRFNEMCADLTEHIDKVYLSEIRQKQAELIAFQAQINPHFLYNTLEAIRMRALHKKADDVGEMIYLLSSLFRYSVKTDTVVTLDNEMEYCSLYLDLFRIRYLNNFTYEIDIEPELMSVPVLKLTIQPVIENYIVHGLKMSRSDNRLHISAEQIGKDVKIIIRDNGSGIPPVKLEQIRRHLKGVREDASRSIGLINTQERIKIYYGSRYGLDIQSEEGLGTTVIITIPADQRGQKYA